MGIPFEQVSVQASPFVCVVFHTGFEVPGFRIALSTINLADSAVICAST